MTNEHLTGRISKWKADADSMLVHADEMTVDQTEAFIALTRHEKDILNNVELIRKVSSEGFFKIATYRSLELGLEISPVALMMLTGYMIDNPAELILYISYIKLTAQKRPPKVIDMHEFALTFPRGFFSKKEREWLWLSQKLTNLDRQALATIKCDHEVRVKTDNLLDWFPALNL